MKKLFSIVMIMASVVMLTTSCNKKDSDPMYVSIATIVEGGGLSGLRKKVEELGGIMSVTSGEYFQVEIIMPKGGRDYV